MARLKDQYTATVLPELKKQLTQDNPMAVPRLEKVIVSVGAGRSTQDSRLLEVASEHLAAITGQHPIITRARKSIAGFKLREGMPIGLKVTLRGERMYEFLDRLIQVTLPRVRDFRGLSPDSFDPQGNYSLGLSEVSVFPETANIDLAQSHGVEITIVTSARNKEEGEALLRALGMPLQERN